MGNWTQNGLSAVAQIVQGLISYVSVGTGLGVLQTSLVSGTPYTSLTLQAGLPAALSVGQSLTVTDGTNVQLVTVASPGASIGATSIPVNSFTPTETFTAGAAAIARTPSAADTQLDNEPSGCRVPTAAASGGSNPGESLISGYFDGTQPSGPYVEVGYWGGPGVDSGPPNFTPIPNGGTLFARDVVFWPHPLTDGVYTINGKQVQIIDTIMFQLDGTL